MGCAGYFSVVSGSQFPGHDKWADYRYGSRVDDFGQDIDAHNITRRIVDRVAVYVGYGHKIRKKLVLGRCGNAATAEQKARDQPSHG